MPYNRPFSIKGQAGESEQDVHIVSFSHTGLQDLAWISETTPSKLQISCEDYVSSPMRTAVEGHGLAVYVAREPCSAYEMNIVDVAGFSISLCLLPPDTTYQVQVALDVTDAVKVLQGKLGWIDGSSEIIERIPVASPPGCVTSMLVDCPEGVIRSGDEGAVFLKMRPSARTDCCTLMAHNILPSFLPCNAREFSFTWEEPCNDGTDGRLEPRKSFFPFYCHETRLMSCTYPRRRRSRRVPGLR